MSTRPGGSSKRGPRSVAYAKFIQRLVDRSGLTRPDIAAAGGPSSRTITTMVTGGLVNSTTVTRLCEAIHASDDERRRALDLLAAATAEQDPKQTTGAGFAESSDGESARQKFRGQTGHQLEFDGVDVGLEVLAGTLGLSFSFDDVHSTPMAERWTAPEELLGYADAFGDRHGLYSGEVARLNKLDIDIYTIDGISERHRLRFEMAPTRYFDMLATNGALGPFSPEEVPILKKGRSGLARTKMSNLVQTELALMTTDGYVPIFERAAGMPFLGECWQITCGETLQRPVDLDADGRPDVFKTARRGLREESGISPEIVHDIAVTAIVATPEFATIGVLMRGRLNCTANDLAERFNRDVLKARDNWEHTGKDLVPIGDVAGLAQALTDRIWTKQSAATMIFAHAEVNGEVSSLAREILARGGLNLAVGSDVRGVVPPDLRDEFVRRYVM